MQVALTVVQDIKKQLPFTVLPSVLGGWIALVRRASFDDNQPSTGGQPQAATPASLQRSPSSLQRSPSYAAAAPPVTKAKTRPVNRARQLKMNEKISDAARQRWEALDKVEQRAMLQVGLVFG